MSTITDNLTATQDQILEAVEKIQGPVVDAVRTVAEKVEGILPEDRPNVPFADSLPEPKELVEFYFDFSQKLLDNQHEFAKAILDAVSPLEAGAGQGFEADGRQEGRLTDGFAVTTSSSGAPGFGPGLRRAGRPGVSAARQARLLRPRSLRGTTGRRPATRSVVPA